MSVVPAGRPRWFEGFHYSSAEIFPDRVPSKDFLRLSLEVAESKRSILTTESRDSVNDIAKGICLQNKEISDDIANTIKSQFDPTFRAQVAYVTNMNGLTETEGYINAVFQDIRAMQELDSESPFVKPGLIAGFSLFQLVNERKNTPNAFTAFSKNMPYFTDRLDQDEVRVFVNDLIPDLTWDQVFEYRALRSTFLMQLRNWLNDVSSNRIIKGGLNLSDLAVEDVRKTINRNILSKTLFSICAAARLYSDGAPALIDALRSGKSASKELDETRELFPGFDQVTFLAKIDQSIQTRFGGKKAFLIGSPFFAKARD